MDDQRRNRARGWNYDNRNGLPDALARMLHRLNFEVSLPGSDLEYYRLSYDFEHYWGLTRWLS